MVLKRVIFKIIYDHFLNGPRYGKKCPLRFQLLILNMPKHVQRSFIVIFVIFFCFIFSYKIVQCSTLQVEERGPKWDLYKKGLICNINVSLFRPLFFSSIELSIFRTINILIASTYSGNIVKISHIDF